MQNNKAIAFIIIIGLAGFFLINSVYVVDETHQAVVTQFQKVVGGPRTAPGLHFKTPFIQQVHYFPKNILDWDGDPGQIPTLDKTYIWVDTFARWRIVDPIAFFLTVTDIRNGFNRLDEVINPAVRNVITSHKLIETVRNSNRKMTTFEKDDLADVNKEETAQYNVETGREKLTKLILAEAQPKLNRFGIELMDMKVKRINYVQRVREAVYGRMIAERKQMAEKIRSMGQGEARKIEGDKDRDLKVIQSEAYRKAEEIKGKADATAVRIYATAYGVDPEFYSFTKSLEIYSQTLEGTDIVLSTNAEFLKYLTEFDPKQKKEKSPEK
ncbi:MAG: protease modulator HflC [Deltaproteobacteria bacterium]|nr:protease modulator HflC [Deltaproteobacteria bacterium]